MIDELIDKLTESIEDARTGRSFPTEIQPATRDDVSRLSDDGWRFDWILQLSVSEVYKLTVPSLGQLVHGLISLSRDDGFVQVNLIESHPENIGRNKKYVGVAGNLFAYATKVAFELGFNGFIAFEAKSELISHYEESLGARRIGDSQRMYLDEEAATKLVAKYFGANHGHRA